MDQIFTDIEKALESDLRRIDWTKAVIYSALKAVEKAKSNAASLPQFLSKEQLLEHLLSDVQFPENSRIKQDSGIEVIVTSPLAEDGTFWCMPCNALEKQEEKINKISEEIRLLTCQHRQEEKMARPVVGNNLYAEYFEAENLWLRVIVEKEMERGQVQVRRIDKGDKQRVEWSQLVVLPKELADVEFMAYQCSLLPECKDKLPYDARWKFNDLTKDSVLNLFVEHEASWRCTLLTEFCLQRQCDALDIRMEVQKSIREVEERRHASRLPAKDMRKLKPQSTKIVMSHSENGVSDVSTEMLEERSPRLSESVDKGDTTKNKSCNEEELVQSRGKQLHDDSGLCLEASAQETDDQGILMQLPDPLGYVATRETFNDESQTDIDFHSLAVSAVQEREAIDFHVSNGHILGQQNTALVDVIPKELTDAVSADTAVEGNLHDEEYCNSEQLVKGGPSLENEADLSVPVYKEEDVDHVPGQQSITRYQGRKGSDDINLHVVKDFSQWEAKWRFKRRRWGKSGFGNPEWAEVQREGLRFLEMHREESKFIVLSATRKRFHFLYKFGFFSPVKKDYSDLRNLLTTFNQQPIFVFFTSFHEAFGCNIGTIGLATSPLYVGKDYEVHPSGKDILQFNCDVISDVELYIQYDKITGEGLGLSIEQGMELVREIKSTLKPKYLDKRDTYQRQFRKKSFRRNKKEDFVQGKQKMTKEFNKTSLSTDVEKIEDKSVTDAKTVCKKGSSEVEGTKEDKSMSAPPEPQNGIYFEGIAEKPRENGILPHVAMTELSNMMEIFGLNEEDIM